MTVDTANIERVVEALGFEVVQLERGGGRRSPRIRLRIDRPGAVPGRSAITVEDCAAVTRALRELSEGANGGEGDWILEVSSPGVDRPLVKAADYDRFAGTRIRVRGFAPLADRGRRLDGTLHGLVPGAGDAFTLEVDGDRVEIPLKAVASARLVHDWDAAGDGGGNRGKR